MQTSIVQSLVGASSSEDGKVLPSTPSTENRFGDLFSQLMLDESIIESDPDLDEAETSDTEFPDELPLGSEVKTRHACAVKIATSAEQTLGVATQIAQPDLGRQISSDMPKTQNRSGDVGQNTGKTLTHQLQNQKLVNAQGQQPEKTQVKEQNLQQIPSIQHEKLSASSNFQIPQERPSNTQNGDIQIQSLQPMFTNQSAEKKSPASVPEKIQIASERNETRQATPGFEQVRESKVRITDGYTLQYSKLQKPIDGAYARQVTPPTAAVSHTQTLPKDSTKASVTQLSTEISNINVSSESIDTFAPTVENAEAELGRANVSFALNTPPPSALETSRAGTVRFAGTQMVDALIRQPDQAVEIALNPEELGRVRIALSHLDTGLTVAISAERPETLDLMRRHIEQLAAEFRRLGYENIGFEFSGGDANSSGQSETESQSSSDQMTDTPDPKTLSPVSTQTTGLDIRL
ncbi:MAG: flagellar hook-length control protein FliK [Paracoccaceae bacterium]